MLFSEEKQAHITTARVKEEAKKAFVDWQTRLNAEIAAFPGFVSLEILSFGDTWTIIQRFSNEESYQAWKHSPQYIALFNELKALLKNEAFQEVDKSPSKSIVTEVFVTKVNPEYEKDYRDWIAKIHQIEASFPGFRGMYVQSPTNDNKNWITFLQFDTPENLDYWLTSKQRKEVLKEAKPFISSLESHRVYSPYAGWFGSLQQKGGVIPPVWKQTMVILLMLFPIVMMEMRYLNPLISGFSSSVGTFIGNAVSVTLLAWPLLPIAIWCLRWWLETRDQRINLLGLGLVLLLYTAEVLFFM